MSTQPGRRPNPSCAVKEAKRIPSESSSQVYVFSSASGARVGRMGKCLDLRASVQEKTHRFFVADMGLENDVLCKELHAYTY